MTRTKRRVFCGLALAVLATSLGTLGARMQEARAHHSMPAILSVLPPNLA